MLTIDVKAADFADLHGLARGALGGGMYYFKPHHVNDDIVGAEGVLLAVNAGSLVACIMATSHRAIIHARIPCTVSGDNNCGLLAVETPKELHRFLRRLKTKPLTLTFDHDRMEIALPRPNNVKGMISLPMRPAHGRMLSAVLDDPATTVLLDADELLAALRRMPRKTAPAFLAIVPSATGVDVLNGARDIIACERLQTAQIDRDCVGAPFVCSARRSPHFVSVIESLKRRGPATRMQISSSRIMIWNDWATAQFFSDRRPDEEMPPSIPETNVDHHDIVLRLDESTNDFPKEVGKWYRRLCRAELTRGGCPSRARWRLSPSQVVLELDCGVQTSARFPCTCDFWPLKEQELHLGVDILATADILRHLEDDKYGGRLVYRDRALTVQSDRRPVQLTTYAHVVDAARSIEDHSLYVHPRAVSFPKRQLNPFWYTRSRSVSEATDNEVARIM